MYEYALSLGIGDNNVTSSLGRSVLLTEPISLRQILRFLPSCAFSFSLILFLSFSFSFSLCSNKGRETLYEILFEELGLASIAMLHPGLLSVIATGRTTGLGVTWGNKLRIAAVVDGYVVPHATCMEQYGGKDLVSHPLSLSRSLAFANETHSPRRTICSIAF